MPADRLLVMDIKDGQAPLYKFLDKSMPNEPFTQTNDARAMDEVVLRLVGGCLLRWFGLFVVAGGAAYTAYRNL